MNKLTVEEYFIQQHGGKTPDESVNHGETFTAIAMTIFADGYASQYKADLTDEEIYKCFTKNFGTCTAKNTPVYSYNKMVEFLKVIIRDNYLNTSEVERLKEEVDKLQSEKEENKRLRGMLQKMYYEFEGTTGMCEPDASCIEVISECKQLLSEERKGE